MVFGVRATFGSIAALLQRDVKWKQAFFEIEGKSL